MTINALRDHRLGILGQVTDRVWEVPSHSEGEGHGRDCGLERDKAEVSE